MICWGELWLMRMSVAYLEIQGGSPPPHTFKALTTRDFGVNNGRIRLITFMGLRGPGKLESNGH